MSKNVPTISTNLKFSAFGATLAMLPITILLMILVILHKDISESTAKTFIVLQFVGCMLWGGCLFGAMNNARKLNISSSGLTMIGTGIFIGGLMQLLFIISPEILSDIFRFIDSGNHGFPTVLIISVVSNLPIFIGSLIAGKHLPALRTGAIWYFLLAVFPFIMMLLGKIIIGLSGWRARSDIQTLFMLSSCILFILCLLSVTAWWKACGNAKEIEEKYTDDNQDYTPVASYVEQPAATPSTEGNYNSNTPAPAKGVPVTEEQKRLIMGMSDEELTKVINNPMLYANPAFVEEARSTLVKRQAWEMIKDYTDAQLLDIVHNNTQGFAYEVLDASSMELLARETEEFVNEIKSLSTEELQGIVTNSGNYFDGYVRLARRTLDERLNNHPSQPGFPG